MGIDFHGPPATQAEIDATTIHALRSRIQQLEASQARQPEAAENHRQQLLRLDQRARRADRELVELTYGRDWSYAARMVRDAVLRLLSDPAMTRSRLHAELVDIVRGIEELGC